MTGRPILLVFMLAMLAIASCFPHAASAAPLIVTQPPCAPTNPGFATCMTFGPTGDIPLVRQFTFTAPSAGMAMFQFHGSAQCENAGTGDGIVILQSQIVDDLAAAPSGAGPGGLWQGVRMLPPNGLIRGRDSFNFASTRVIRIRAAGQKIVRFKIGRVNMSPDTICAVFNSAFSVVFVP